MTPNSADEDGPPPPPPPKKKKAPESNESAASSSAAATIATPMDASTRRSKILAEIVSSERVYNSALSSVVTVYIERLKPLATTAARGERIKAIFGNVANILLASNTLLEKLEACDVDDEVGRCFVEVLPLFGFYSEYSNNYESALKTLVALTESDAPCRDIVEKCDQSCNASLQSLVRRPKSSVGSKHSNKTNDAQLIQPIQRLPRYQMLLSDLLRHTDAVRRAIGLTISLSDCVLKTTTN